MSFCGISEWRFMMLMDLVSCGFPGDIDLSPNNDTSLMLNECLMDLYRWLEN